MNYHILREYISLLLKEEDSCNCGAKAESDDDEKQMLSEPDESEEGSKKRDEQAVVSSIFPLPLFCISRGDAQGRLVIAI